MKHPAQPVLLVTHPPSERVLPLSGALEEKERGGQEEKGSGDGEAESFAACEDGGGLRREEELGPGNVESFGSRMRRSLYLLLL